MTFSKTGGKKFNLSWKMYIHRERKKEGNACERRREFWGLMDLSFLKYIKMIKQQNNDF